MCEGTLLSLRLASVTVIRIYTCEGFIHTVMQNKLPLKVYASRNHYSTSIGILLPKWFEHSTSAGTPGHVRAMSGNATEPCFWEESLHFHLCHTLHSVLQAITVQFPVVPEWRMCIIMLNRIVSGKIVVLFLMEYTWLFFSAQWSNTESQRWQVSIGIVLIVLQLQFFWSDINPYPTNMEKMVSS